ncbi:MAG: alpha/beta hydrolase [Hyphomicrobiaceae bacterium]
MRKVAPLHPEAKRVLEIIAELEKDVVPPVSLDTMRSLMRARTSRLAAQPPTVGRIENRSIPSKERPVALRLYYPGGTSAGPLPACIYAHGGGFVVGDLDMVETICRSICRDAGIVVVSVDYRLAPEHRFPAGLDDMTATVRFVARNAAELGIDADRLAVGGDSAGGNLAAAAAQALRGPGGIALRYQVLVYPVTDLTCSQPSYSELGTGYPLTEDRMRNYIRLYLDDPARQASDPRASPLLAASLAGLPPALVVVAGLDPLVDEGVAYARRLQEARIGSELVEVPDHPHGFLGWTREAKAARDALAHIGRRLKEHLVDAA